MIGYSQGQVINNLSEFSDGTIAYNLIAVIQKISSARTLDEIIKIVRVAARKLTGADGATFVLRAGEFCYYAEENAIEPLWKGLRFPIDICISGWVMLNKIPAMIEDIYLDSRIPHEAYRPTFVKSLAMVPIRSEDPIAAIGNYWASPHMPTAQEMEILQALANTVSVAMENVQLYASLEARIKELDLANKAKDEFLMTISHELRTPLNAIIGWSDMLLGGELNSDQVHEGIKTISRNAQTEALIIDELLDSTRIVNGRFRLEKKPLNLVAIIQDSITSMRPLADKKFIKINLQEFTEFGILLGDRERCQQILFNLLSNAIKFSPNNSNIEVSVVREGPHACIHVRDYGQGIDSQFMPQLFDRFSQADSSMTRKYGGLGLGLAIVRHLVEAHGGTITAESPGINQGSDFKVSLPLSEIFSQKTTDKSLINSLLLPLQKIRVLVVDDELDARSIVKVVLNHQGAEVQLAGSTVEADSILEDFYPNILICDLSMPVEDGCTYIRRLRSQMNFVNLPAIALTAFSDREHERDALDAGFNTLMGKPLRPKKLVELIANMVQLPV